jgi:aminopeptidase N
VCLSDDTASSGIIAAKNTFFLFMMMNFRVVTLGLLISTALVGGCHLFRKMPTTPPVLLDDSAADNDAPVWIPKKFGYHATERRVYDLLHTTLKVRPDWQKRRLAGEATLKMRPYFYPTDSLKLDAKGFDIHEVAIMKGEQ